MSESRIIRGQGLKTGTTTTSFDLHVSRGLRGVLVEQPMQFVIFPVISSSTGDGIGPFTIADTEAILKSVGHHVLGVDSITKPSSPLITRIWTPRCGIQAPQAADLWANICANLSDDDVSGDARLARHLSVCIRAAGIRIRDASDHYHQQLGAAVAEGCEHGRRFSNIPLADIRLALHSILTELASARDYLAMWFGRRLGADGVGSWRSLSKWMKKHPDAELPPGLREMTAASAETAEDPWLWILTNLRNVHVHEEPLGSGRSSKWLIYEVTRLEHVEVPMIRYPVGDVMPRLQGQDYLEAVHGLFNKFNACAVTAARGCGTNCEMGRIELQ